MSNQKGELVEDEWQIAYNKGFEEGMRQATPKKMKQQIRKEVYEKVLEMIDKKIEIQIKASKDPAEDSGVEKSILVDFKEFRIDIKQKLAEVEDGC